MKSQENGFQPWKNKNEINLLLSASILVHGPLALANADEVVIDEIVEETIGIMEEQYPEDLLFAAMFKPRVMDVLLEVSKSIKTCQKNFKSESSMQVRNSQV